MSEISSNESHSSTSLLSLEDARGKLFVHESLFDLWRASFINGFDWKQLALASVVGVLVFGASIVGESATSAVNMTRAIATDGLTFATTLLGFLIAGFTVFATITKPEIFALMARWPEDDGGTHLQKVFLLFMQVFAHYCTFCVVSLLVKLVGAPNGALSLFFKGCYPELKLVLASMGAAFFSGWLIYLMLLLPIFIFNMYSMQLVVIDYTMTEMEKESSESE